jgi:hypothetical protein
MPGAANTKAVSLALETTTKENKRKRGNTIMNIEFQNP